MSLVKGLARAREAAQNRDKRALEMKEEGKSVIGYICCFAPPEIMHAAGVFPYRITGSPGDTTSEADSYLEPYGCPYVRNVFSQYLKGRMDFLDGLVISHSCDMVQRLYGVWTYYRPLPYSRLVNVPHQLFQHSQDFFQRELAFFKKSLEEYCQKEISNDTLKESIRLFNRIRGLLRELYQLRAEDEPRLLGSELLEVIIAGEVLPPEDFEELLKETLEEVKNRAPFPAGKRVLVWGSILDHPAFYRLIEEAGGQVVADDTCLGMRFWYEDVQVTGDPFQGLKDFYLVNFMCPRTDRGTELERFRYLLDLAEEYRARGVIGYTISFCDPHKLDYPDLRDYFKEHGYPMLEIDDNYSLLSEGAVSTRIQAFLEML